MELRKKLCYTIIILCFFFAVYLSTGVTETRGTSMLPTLPNEGGVVYLTQFYPSNLTGEIIIYENNGYINTHYTRVCHRVISDDGQYVICQGDNNNEPDPNPVSKDDIVGVVCAKSSEETKNSLFNVSLLIMAVTFIYLEPPFRRNKN